jgi:hypothetical protein
MDVCVLSGNLALGRPTAQSSNYSDNSTSEVAVDGNTDPYMLHASCSHTLSDWNAWWRVDLAEPAYILNITVFNRQSSSCEFQSNASCI